MKKMSVFLLLITAAVLALFVWSIKDVLATESVLPVFKMSDKIVYDKLLLIRRTVPNGNLLLKLLNEKTIFQYDIDRKSVSEVGEQVWNNAAEKVSVCGRVPETNESGERNLNAYGKYVLAVTDSPRRTKTAVVSARGPKGPNISLLFPLGGGGKIWGNRYLEIKENRANYPTDGKPFRVREMITPQICWTEDENIVVVYDSWIYSFSVVNLNPRQTSPPVQKPLEQLPSKPDLSRLTGVARDYGVDEDGDGLFEKIAVEIETETSFPGQYQIFVRLKSSGDKYFLQTVDVELKGGIERTKLLFDTKPLFEEKIDGVFKIEMADLTYGHYPFLERREDLGETRSYKLAQFGRPNVVFTGENIVTPIDENRNGKYEGLRIKVGVDVLDAGDYEFQGDLYHEFSNVTAEGVVEFFHGKTNLKKGKGTITFFFGGGKIIEHGKSGKFRLRYVVVYKTGGSAPFVDTLLETTAFDVNRFESEN